MGGVEENVGGQKIFTGCKKKRSSKEILGDGVKELSRRQKVSNIHAKRRSWHPKMVNFKTFCPNLTFKNRYTTSKKKDQLAGFLLHSPLSEIGKNIGKISKYTPIFKVLSAPLPRSNAKLTVIS